MNRIERPASEFKSLCLQLGYRRRTVVVAAVESVTLQGLNWDGGSKYVYSAVDLQSGKAVTPELGIAHPMFNENEGARIAMRPDVVICQHGVFMGKPSRMVIYVHPSNMPKFVENQHAPV